MTNCGKKDPLLKAMPFQNNQKICRRKFCLIWLTILKILSGDCLPLSLINVQFVSGLVLRMIQAEGAIVTWFTSSPTAVSVPTLWVLLWDIWSTLKRLRRLKARWYVSSYRKATIQRLALLHCCNSDIFCLLVHVYNYFCCHGVWLEVSRWLFAASTDSPVQGHHSFRK